MSLLIGLDEAGYGPNLGPLVVAATAWEVPGDPRDCDLWSAFAGVVANAPDPTRRTVHVADSKAVHSPAAGIAAIERSATVLLKLAGRDAPSLFALWDRLTDGDGRLACGEPWFLADDHPLPLAEPPHAAAGHDAAALAAAWSDRCAAAGVRLAAVAADLIPAARFNAATAAADSKGRVLSEATLALLRRLWDPSAGEPALVLCDKHGGRNRYADLLTHAFPEFLPLPLAESRDLARYRVGDGEVRFQPRSETHLPVAAASIVAKYLREASMTAFNRFWAARLPGLKPTAGYPADAKRFLAAIEPAAAALGLPRETYWRYR